MPHEPHLFTCPFTSDIWLGGMALIEDPILVGQTYKTNLHHR
jgi:hypothetical protein